MATMLKEAGVIALYGTSFVDAIVEHGIGDDTITAIIVENASGRQAITGKIFIEGSGTAQLAAAAGVPFVRGGGPQPETADWDGVQRPIPGGLALDHERHRFRAHRRASEIRQRSRHSQS